MMFLNYGCGTAGVSEGVLTEEDHNEARIIKNTPNYSKDELTQKGKRRGSSRERAVRKRRAQKRKISKSKNLQPERKDRKRLSREKLICSQCRGLDGKVSSK